ncbi:hypothetical protein SJAV_21610 [Sulfurisphaera javensis]|uniref:Uncharacterized protein n=1 Tax=Sulfurisphaera javensis TaxID=2049879 RepID=A0AAT9GTS1_9CREN
MSVEKAPIANISVIANAILNSSVSSIQCQWSKKSEIFDNIYNYPAISVPGRVSTTVGNRPVIDIIRHGIVVRIEIDSKHQEVAQKIWRNNKYGLIFIGSVSPLGVGGRELNILQGGRHFYVELPSGVYQNFYQNYGNKIIVVPIVPANPNFSKDPVKYLSNFISPKSSPEYDVNYNPLLDNVSGDISLENKYGVMIGMPNYAFYMALERSWLLSFNSSYNSLVSYSGGKYQIEVGVLQNISRAPPNIWYPILMKSKIEQGDFLAISLLPNASNLGTRLAQAIEKLLDNSNVSYKDHEKMMMLSNASDIFGSNAIIGTPIFYTNRYSNKGDENRSLAESCSNELFIGEVSGIASVNQTGAIVYIVKKIKLPKTYSEAVELANQLGTSNIFTSLESNSS